MPDPLRHVRALAEEIGPREATGLGEARAACYIAEAARAYTHQVWLEPFQSFASRSLPNRLLFGAALFAGLLLPFSWIASVVVATVAAVCLIGQWLRWIELGWLFPRRASQNVVAVVPSAQAIRRRLVLIAHCDSASGRAGDHESAAGAALLLAAGEALARSPLQHTEVWTVYTGCKEPGSIGLQFLLQRYGDLLTDADFVVLDRIGGGVLAYTAAEGIFPIRAADADLTGYLHELGVRPLPGARRRTQAALLLDEGFRAVSLLTSGQGRVSPRTLHDLVRLLRALGEAIDSDACAEAAAESAGM